MGRRRRRTHPRKIDGGIYEGVVNSQSKKTHGNTAVVPGRNRGRDGGGRPIVGDFGPCQKNKIHHPTRPIPSGFIGRRLSREKTPVLGPGHHRPLGQKGPN